MNQTSRFTLGRALSSLKATAPVKSVYALAFALLLASAVLVAFPLTTTKASTCSAACGQGETISVTGSTCSCTDNTGCTWTAADGKHYESSCGKVPISGFATVADNVCE
jgi:hypothetical protein